MNDRINYGNIVHIVEEIQNEFEQPGSKSIFSKLFLNLYRFVPEWIKEKILRPMIWRYRIKERKERFFVSDGDYKKWSIDFLLYILKNPNISFDLSIFHHKEDKKEIIKFVRNKLFLALGNKVRKDKLFSNEDFVSFYKYNEYFKRRVEIGKDEITTVFMNDQKYILPYSHIDISVFYYKLGIDCLPESTLNSLKEKDFIDCGAFIGDSALVLSKELGARRVFAFEPDFSNYKNLIETIKLNKLETKIFPIRKGVGDFSKNVVMFNKGEGSYIPKYKNQTDKVDGKTISITTIDDLVRENNLDIGLIKMDIEGFELEAIWGAENTIKHFKPALFISLYHRGKDFFEIPTLLNNWVSNYEYRFLYLNRNCPIGERILVAY